MNHPSQGFPLMAAHKPPRPSARVYVLSSPVLHKLDGRVRLAPDSGTKLVTQLGTQHELEI
jgi:hypothetical protein